MHKPTLNSPFPPDPSEHDLAVAAHEWRLHQAAVLIEQYERTPNMPTDDESIRQRIEEILARG